MHQLAKLYKLHNANSLNRNPYMRSRVLLCSSRDASSSPWLSCLTFCKLQPYNYKSVTVLHTATHSWSSLHSIQISFSSLLNSPEYIHPRQSWHHHKAVALHNMYDTSYSYNIYTQSLQNLSWQRAITTILYDYCLSRLLFIVITTRYWLSLKKYHG